MNDAEKICPFCGELIKQVAIKCKHCNSDLSNISIDKPIKFNERTEQTSKITKISNTSLNEKKENNHLSSHNYIFSIIFGLISIVLVVLVIVFLRSNFSPSQFFKSEKVSDAKDVQEFIIGDVAQNKSLAYRVNGIQFLNRVGNFFIGQDAGQGNKFLIIDVEIKNIDTESRMIDGGEVRASYNGKWLKFESPEPVFSDDYITFDVLNPLTSIRGKIAFKVPAQLEGPFYWIPPRTNGRIKLTTQRDSSAQTQNQSKSSSPNSAISINKDNTNAASKNKTNETEKTVYDEHFRK